MPEPTRTGGSSATRPEKQKLPSARRVLDIARTGIAARLGRSLITMTGICLALAYLLAVRIGGIVTERVAMLTQSVNCYDPRGAFLGLDAAYDDALGVTREQVDAWRAALLKRAGQDILRRRRAEAAAERVAPPALADIESGAWPAVESPAARAANAAAFAVERERAARQIAGELEARLEEEGLASDLRTTAALRQQRAANAWIIGIVAIVAVAGVTNAIFMSVTERFREIGTMKCLGAMDRLVLLLFLIETAVVGVSGALIGVLGGSLLSVAQYGGRYAWAAAVDIPWGAMAAAVWQTAALGVALTVIGGLAPAGRAARMAPVEAMRVDQ